MPLDLSFFNHVNTHLPGFHKALGTFVSNNNAKYRNCWDALVKINAWLHLSILLYTALGIESAFLFALQLLKSPWSITSRSRWWRCTVTRSRLWNTSKILPLIMSHQLETDGQCTTGEQPCVCSSLEKVIVETRWDFTDSVLIDFPPKTG